jgi:hypothetical protein
MPRRPLHLLIYPSAGGHTPAHWSLFIPSLPNRSLGKIIHAVGTPFTGYALVFKRNYNLETEERKVQSLWLCDVADEYVVDTPGDGGRMVEDVDAVDRLEEEAGRVVCPGVWKRPLDAFGVCEIQNFLFLFLEFGCWDDGTD